MSGSPIGAHQSGVTQLLSPSWPTYSTVPKSTAHGPSPHAHAQAKIVRAWLKEYGLPSLLHAHATPAAPSQQPPAAGELGSPEQQQAAASPPPQHGTEQQQQQLQQRQQRQQQQELQQQQQQQQQQQEQQHGAPDAPDTIHGSVGAAASSQTEGPVLARPGHEQVAGSRCV